MRSARSPVIGHANERSPQTQAQLILVLSQEEEKIIPIS